VDAHRLFGEPPEELRAVANLPHALGDDLAHLQGHQRGEVLGAGDDHLEDRPQDLASLARRGRGPVGLHRAGGVQRGQAVPGGCVGHLGQHFIGGRVDHVEGRRARSILAADPHAGRNR